MSCKYLSTGQLECKEDFVSGEAKIGEECSNKSCSEGACVAPYGRGRGSYCYNVINKGEKGCEKSFAICAKGMECKDNVCIKDNDFSPPTEKVGKDTSVAKSKKEKEETGITINIGTSSLTILLYAILGIVILVCLIALIYLIVKK
jgi:hypothetical protein